MTTPNTQPTELDKAIEEVKSRLAYPIESYNGSEWMSVDMSTIKQLLLAAKRLKEVEKERERLWDLVRYQRAELHQENLISDDEYLTLLADSKSKARLETYDDLRQELTQLRAGYKQALEQLVSIRPDKDCPFCTETEPCGNCYALASLQGKFHRTLSTPLAIATMKGGQ